MSTLSLEIRDNVALVRMIHGVSNGINADMVREMKEVLAEVKRSARAMVLAGNEKIFSMGLHLPSLLNLSETEMLDFYNDFNDMCLDLYTLPMPTAAAVAGHAPAGGTVLATTCDFRMVSAKAKMGLNEIWLGMGIPYLAHLLLRQIVGDRYATTMGCGGQLYKAEECLAMKLADDVHPPDEVEARTMEKMTLLASLSPTVHAANKSVRTEFIRDRYRAVGREKNQGVLDFWFDPQNRPMMELAASKF